MVHPSKKLIDASLEKEMGLGRKVVEVGHAARKLENIKVRIPMAKLEIAIEENPSEVSNEIWEVVLKELNVKNIFVNKKIKYPKQEVKVSNDELKKEGELRELIRTIQAKRKELGLQPTDMITVTIPHEFGKNADYLKKKLLAREIILGNELNIEL
ncbi:hypothetical protein HY041_02580 [Candidatus Roizmanbacteria bacterium]|nr:hypothetical protein [Candidatus Roizmanbacteria bacterium]